MSTQLGKELKKLRIDQGITLIAMSRIMNISVAFLSAIETGRKRVPDDFLDRLAEKFSAVARERSKYEVLINQARKEVSMSLEGATFEDAQTATNLANKFLSMSPSDKQVISNLFKVK